MTSSPHLSSLEIAQRVGASAGVCRVLSTTPLAPSLHSVVLEGDVESLVGRPGQDVMVRLQNAEGAFVRRRYTVRSVDPAANTFTLWISTAHDGAGSRWATSARIGDDVDVVGPRGKIFLNEQADWHLFMGDVSGLGAFYRMAESIEVPGRAIFIVEIEDPRDAVTATFDEGLGVTGIFVDREGRARNDVEGLLSGLAAFSFPPDEGHAYLFGEFSVLKVLRGALRDRGLADDAVSHKAFWRMGQANADGGEPNKND